MTSLTNRSKEHSEKELNIENLNPDPLLQFNLWINNAIDINIPEPNAMCLSTTTPKGKPSSRIVLLKKFDNKGFVFFTNYQSRKGKEIEENPYGSLLFYWQKLKRQIRIEGRIRRISPEESDKYFNERPTGSQIGAWASPQSKIIPDRKFLDSEYLKFQNQFNTTEIKRPPYWGGFRLVPEKFEFWQERENRLHNRFLYELKDNKWVIVRLAP